MREELDSAPDARLARVAARQHGVVSTAQLRRVGIDKSGVDRRLRAGRLHRVHRGVYAVGHPGLGWLGRWMAAVLACGEGAALSHLSAAALWGLLRPAGAASDVSIPTSAGRARQQGIRLHRCRSLAVSSSSRMARGTRHAPLVTVRNRIPVTSVARTVDDLWRTAPPRLARRAQRQAELARFALSGARQALGTRSDLEQDFLAFLRRHRLPAPEVGVRIGGHEVDFFWRECSLAVETDFYGTHRGEVSFEGDHRRDLDLRRAGLTVLRYTGAQIRAQPAEIAAELRELLRRAAARRGPTASRSSQ
ncbi:MAG: type IV toxin-antitoxin system AbiEi family antitoxin domain-containing protein [Solirubrobacterales bacterium]